MGPDGLLPRTERSLDSALAYYADRLVLWQVEALAEDVASRGDLPPAAARLVAVDLLLAHAPQWQDRLGEAYREHVADIAARYTAEFGGAGEADPASLPLARAVGFADMVAWTERTADLDAEALAEFVHRHEVTARETVVRHGGRVVKTIGDAVLFVADHPGTGLRIACDLAGHGDAPVRTSVVWGRVLSRFGDVFGPPVNLAARLSDVAEPGAVLTDTATLAALAGTPGLVADPPVDHDLPGIGPVAAVRVRLAG